MHRMRKNRATRRLCVPATLVAAITAVAAFSAAGQPVAAVAARPVGAAAVQPVLANAARPDRAAAAWPIMAAAAQHASEAAAQQASGAAAQHASEAAAIRSPQTIAAEDTAADAKAPAGDAVPEAPAKPAAYRERRNVVQLSLDAMYARIPEDSEDYKVVKKRVDIAKRRLSYAMHDKFVADGTPAPAATIVMKRLEWEMARQMDWRRAEIDVAEAEHGLSDKRDAIESGYRARYYEIQNAKESMASLEREIDAHGIARSAVEARVAAGLSVASELDAYAIEEARLGAEMRRRERALALAERRLKTDLGIDQSKGIELEPVSVPFKRMADRRIKLDIADAIESDFTMGSLAQRAAMLKEERAIMLQCDRDGELMEELQVNETAILEAEYELADHRSELEASLWSDHYALLALEDGVAVAELAAKIAASKALAAEARLAQGSVSDIEARRARIERDAADAAHRLAVDEYMRAAADFALRLV